MSYTLAEAATAAGVYKSTVLRAIKSGKISGAKNEMGEWIVEPVELQRVYPPVARSDGGHQCNTTIHTRRCRSRIARNDAGGARRGAQSRPGGHAGTAG